MTPTIFATNTTSHLVAMPATVTAGNLLLMLTAFDGSTTTSPSGWTELENVNANAHLAFMAAKVADGTEGGTTVDVVTAGAEQGTAQVYQISGWWGTLATGVAIGSRNGAGGVDTIDVLSLNPASWDIEFTLWIAVIAVGKSTAAQNVSTYPTGYTDGVETDSGGGGTGALIASAIKESAVAFDDPDSFVLDSAPSGSSTRLIAIRPAAASGVTGTVAVTQADQTSAAAAVETIPGTSTATQADQTPTASGTETFTATSTVSQTDQTSTASGTVTNPAVTGTAAATQADQTSTATGSVVNPVTGTAAVTQADQTSTATAAETFTGTSANVQADQTAAAVGVLTIVGTSTASQDDQTSTASGTALLAVTGTVAVTQEDQFSTISGDAGIVTFWQTDPAGYTANPAAYTPVRAGDTPPSW